MGSGKGGKLSEGALSSEEEKRCGRDMEEEDKEEETVGDGNFQLPSRSANPVDGQMIQVSLSRTVYTWLYSRTYHSALSKDVGQWKRSGQYESAVNKDCLMKFVNSHDK